MFHISQSPEPVDVLLGHQILNHHETIFFVEKTLIQGQQVVVICVPSKFK